MKEYELTVLIHPDAEATLETVLEKVRALVTNNGGVIKSEDNWGKKKLAYQINRQDFAIYVAFDVELPAAAPRKISDAFNITDAVLRYLLVKTDEKTRQALEAERQRAAERESQKAAEDAEQDA